MCGIKCMLLLCFACAGICIAPATAVGARLPLSGRSLLSTPSGQNLGAVLHSMHCFDRSSDVFLDSTNWKSSVMFQVCAWDVIVLDQNLAAE